MSLSICNIDVKKLILTSLTVERNKLDCLSLKKIGMEKAYSMRIVNYYTEGSANANGR
jgi:hypothetical protein